ncbi:MAG: ATP phosphoribosyltransferase regulatory subunit, partial [Candidatus Doudnabacteria bacterium]|nr:ATP phosphoribosyltransferase regulatory subunit [Candidatus Doudnabacteria bacterium]
MGRPKKITPIVEKAPARLQGSYDLLPDQHLSYDFFMEKFMNQAHTFGYSRIETPMLEDAKLFKQWELLGKGELLRLTDDKGNNRTALKPMNLFGLVRA